MEIYREGNAQRQMELMSPFGIYHFMRDPSLKTAVNAAYMPTMGYLGMRWVAFVVGESLPPFWGRVGHHVNLFKSQAKSLLGGTATVGRTVMKSSPYLFGAAVLGSTVRGIETGRYEETLPGQILTPLIKGYFSSTKKDTGYELFEFSR